MREFSTGSCEFSRRNRGASCGSINPVDCKVSTVTCAKTFRVSRKNIDDDARRRVPFTPLFIIFRADPRRYTHAKLSRWIPRGIGVRFHCEVTSPENRQFGKSGDRGDESTRGGIEKTYGITTSTTWRGWLTIISARSSLSREERQWRASWIQEWKRFRHTKWCWTKLLDESRLRGRERYRDDARGNNAFSLNAPRDRIPLIDSPAN